MRTTWVGLSLRHTSTGDRSFFSGDPAELGLLLSTAVSGSCGMWMWLAATSRHVTSASYFLLINWAEGLASFPIILLLRFDYYDIELTSISWRLQLVCCEIIYLQALVQDRLKSLWPPRRSSGLCLEANVVGMLLCGTLNAIIVFLDEEHHGQVSVFGAYLMLANFIGWSLHALAKLCCILCVLHRALGRVQSVELLDAVKCLKVSRKEISLQASGIVFSLTTTCLFVIGLVVTSSWNAWFTYLVFALVSCINLLFNAAGAILFSGAHRSLCKSADTAASQPPTRCRCLRRKGAKVKKQAQKIPTKGIEWEEKTQKLAARGVSLRKLLEFYRSLGNAVMPSYQPGVHTTNDVVRLAVIPLTAAAGSSYAELVNESKSVMPKKMVTHNWSNLFRDLLAAVVADALDEHTFEFIAELLADQAGIKVVEQILCMQDHIDDTYWTPIKFQQDLLCRPPVIFTTTVVVGIDEKAVAQGSVHSR